LVGWIVLGVIVLVLAALALLKVGVWLEYSAEGFVLRVKVGPLAIQILPSRPKKEKKKKPPKQKKQAKPKEPPEPKPKQGGIPSLVLRLLPVVAEAAGQFKRKLVIDRLWLSFTAGGASDAAAGAILYGRVSAAMGMLVPVLENNFNLEDRRFHSGVDFGADHPAIYLHAVLTIRMGQVIALAARCGLRCWKEYRAWRKEHPRPDGKKRRSADGPERKAG
jgi:hypothetical protein